jgi:hypothetical protein
VSALARCVKQKGGSGSVYVWTPGPTFKRVPSLAKLRPATGTHISAETSWQTDRLRLGRKKQPGVRSPAGFRTQSVCSIESRDTRDTRERVALCEVCQADHDSVGREMNSKPAGPGGTRALARTVRVAKRPTGQMRISESSQGRSKAHGAQGGYFVSPRRPKNARLPTPKARRSWSMRTIRAVRSGSAEHGQTDTGVEEHARGEEEEMG